MIAALTCLGGAGFGMAWTFILRKATAVAPGDEAQRIANAITTVQRLGYALGAALIGILANGLGFEDIALPGDAGATARWMFGACALVAVLGLLVMPVFVREKPTVERPARVR